MVGHFCKTSIQNTEAGGFELRVQGQSELYVSEGSPMLCGQILSQTETNKRKDKNIFKRLYIE